jgi:hypothetical protein
MAAAVSKSPSQAESRFACPHLTEKQILSFKPAPRLELVGNKHSERVQDRKHRSQ